MGSGKIPSENNTVRVIDLTCRNNPDPGAPPFWDPPYDHLINPFPECVFIREYFFVIISQSHIKKAVREQVGTSLTVSTVSHHEGQPTFKFDT